MSLSSIKVFSNITKHPQSKPDNQIHINFKFNYVNIKSHMTANHKSVASQYTVSHMKSNIQQEIVKIPSPIQTQKKTLWKGKGKGKEGNLVQGGSFPLLL